MGTKTVIDGVELFAIHREGKEVFITLPWRDARDRVTSILKVTEIDPYSGVLESAAVHQKYNVAHTLNLRFKFPTRESAVEFNKEYDPESA